MLLMMSGSTVAANSETPVTILGISCYYHDAAAVLVRDGVLVAAAHEERFTRQKHDQRFPVHAVRYCLAQAGCAVDDIDYVGFYDRPLLKFERMLYTYLATVPLSMWSFVTALPVWLKEKLWIPHIIREELEYEGEILFADHHVSHAASAFLVSPFDEAAILTIDGVGEWETTAFGTGRGTAIEMSRALHFPHSLGLLYSAFTYFLGFKVNSAEYKVMGLAPYGRPRYADLIRDRLLAVREDGSFKVNMRYFTYAHALRMIGPAFEKLFGEPSRSPEAPLTQFHKDVAASVQLVTEDLMLGMARHVHRETGMDRLCLAGGVALNCVANGRILRETPFKDIYIQPAAGDAGGALGVAYYIYHTILGQPRGYVLKHAFHGPDFSDEEIERYLRTLGVPCTRLERKELLSRAAERIAAQAVVGWFQGRMEWGPRALGNRSILADARNPENQSRVNLKIKFRESFRPFAPSVLEEKAGEYFDIGVPSPYMLLTAQVHPHRRTIPSVTHVDGSARLQTVSRQENELFHDLLREFDRQTGCPVLINTSFNVRGEPIVCTPHDAFACFMNTDMDALALGSFWLEKSAVSAAIDRERFRQSFEPD